MIYPNGDEVYYLEVIYLCRSWHGEPRRQPEELSELRFFNPKDITMDMISPSIRTVMAAYLAGK